MRLLDTSTFEIKEFFGDQAPPYEILSHTWDADEVSFQDVKDGDFCQKRGFSEVRESCRIAHENGLMWIWIDTCCIDKSSSSELGEAINSMYGWYEGATDCYAYLSDLHTTVSVDLASCRWFTRGWTLQELIAPLSIIFYNESWNFVGTKADLREEISAITGIPLSVLGQYVSPSHFNVASGFSWASKRQTTRVEDTTYCLMGLFGVNMSPLYSEGAENSFLRLQEEILKWWDDHSIFLWTHCHEPDNHGLLATSPRRFCRHSVCFTWLREIEITGVMVD